MVWIPEDIANVPVSSFILANFSLSQTSEDDCTVCPPITFPLGNWMAVAVAVILHVPTQVHDMGDGGLSGASMDRMLVHEARMGLFPAWWGQVIRWVDWIPNK